MLPSEAVVLKGTFETRVRFSWPQHVGMLIKLAGGRNLEMGISYESWVEIFAFYFFASKSLTIRKRCSILVLIGVTCENSFKESWTHLLAENLYLHI